MSNCDGIETGWKCCKFRLILQNGADKLLAASFLAWGYVRAWFRGRGRGSASMVHGKGKGNVEGEGGRGEGSLVANRVLSGSETAAFGCEKKLF